jgi:hypothetical protein
VVSHSFDLFLALYKYNPHSKQQLDVIRESIDTITRDLKDDIDSSDWPSAKRGGEGGGAAVMSYRVYPMMG